MNRFEISLVALVLVPASVSCGPTVNSVRFVELAPRRAASDVQLFSTTLPECPYQEVGLVSGTSPDRFSSMQEVLQAMQQRVREMGGDAVIGLGIGQRVSGGTVIGGTGVSVGSSPLLSGTVVRFTDPDCRH